MDGVEPKVVTFTCAKCGAKHDHDSWVVCPENWRFIRMGMTTHGMPMADMGPEPRTTFILCDKCSPALIEWVTECL